MSSGGSEDGEAIQGVFGAQLLEDTDGCVGHEHDAEQAVLEGPHDRHHHEERAQDGVEAGEDVGSEDLSESAPGGRGRGVDLAGDDPGLDLLWTEAIRCVVLRANERPGARGRRCPSSSGRCRHSAPSIYRSAVPSRWSRP